MTANPEMMRAARLAAAHVQLQRDHRLHAQEHARHVANRVVAVLAVLAAVVASYDLVLLLSAGPS